MMSCMACTERFCGRRAPSFRESSPLPFLLLPKRSLFLSLRGLFPAWKTVPDGTNPADYAEKYRDSPDLPGEQKKKL